MEQQERKYFVSEDSRLDADSAAFAVSPNSWVNMENCRILTTDAGVTKTVESIGSTLLISEPEPSVTHIELGSAEDVPNSRMLYFLYDIYGTQHKIKCVYSRTLLEYTVLLSSQITGGLNFDKNKPIFSARVIDGYLHWVDNLNEPKAISIDAGIKLNDPSFSTDVEPYVSPIEYTTPTLIKRPPIYRLQPTKNANGSYPNNYIKDGAFQFTYFYEYKNFQLSALSAYSILVPYNSAESTYNYVTVAVPFAEHIDDYVLRVYICVKFGNDGKTGYFKVWDKNLAADAAAIELHNAGTTALSVDFYNDILPIFLDDVFANQPFDDVPLNAKTLELVRNRVLLANLLSGYNTPTSTSLTLTLTTTDTNADGEWDGQWGFVTLYANITPTGGQNTFMYPFVQLTSGSTPSGGTLLYFPNARINGTWNGGIYPADLLATENLSDATIQATSEADLITSLKVTQYPHIVSGTLGTPIWNVPYDISYNSFGGTSAMTVLNYTVNSVNNFVKSGGVYNVSIAFYDRFRRKCGIVNMPQSITIPYRTDDQTTFNSAIQWALSNIDAVNEIPDWAYYYQIHITKNLKTRFFVQATATAGNYVTKDSDGNYDYTATAFTNDTYATALKLDTLTSLGLGYSFTEGDIIVLYNSGTPVILNVLEAVDGYVLFQARDMGTLGTGLAILYEIYTPYLASLSEPYYETGEVMTIVSPATAERAYSIISGVINGDVYALERVQATTYIVEAMSPNDKEWYFWQTDTGWTNTVDYIGQKQKKNTIVYSDTYIVGSKKNDLNKFQPLSAAEIPQECDQIQKLQLTSKVENQQGIVLLCICEKETASIYVGETQQYGSNTATTLTVSTNVIGTINVLKGSFGTVNPESVCQYRGEVLWLDANNGRWIQYSINGLFPISNYNMTRFWNLWSKKYLSMTAEEIEDLGCRPFVFSCVDPHHNELLISIPKLSDTPPKGYLPDYPDVIYPFDILDFQAKTLVYKLGIGAGTPRWLGSYTFYAEGFISLQDNLYSFSRGLLYLHNQTTTYNQFYGVQYKSRIACISNLIPQVPKIYDNVSVEANMKPSWIYMYNDYPYVQATDIFSWEPEWGDLEGVFYVTIKRNKLSTGYVNGGLLTGEKMRNTAMMILFEFTVDTTPLELRFVTIGFNLSTGHTNQLKQ